MRKEEYVKPEVKSEILEPGALAQAGSGGGDTNPWIEWWNQPSSGACCET
jgi:hypothetical protein